MTDTPNGYRALPWYSDGYRVYDADGIEVANTFTPELALGSAKEVAKDIAESANAHYGAPDASKTLGSLLDAKDARIVTLEGRAQVAEELVKKLQKEAGARNERWAIMVREVDKRDARIAELERTVQDYRDYYVHQYIYDDLKKLKDVAEKRAEAAEADVKKRQEIVVSLRDKLTEERLVNQGNLAAANAMRERAEAAEKRAEQAEIDRSELLKYYERYQEAAKRAEDAEARLVEAEARVRELEQYSTLGYTTREELPQETFTAPDGRVFRVGQRVWHTWEEPGEFGHVTDINGGFPFVQFRDDNDQTSPNSLRRVWDNWDDPDIPTWTVLRDANGNSWLVGELGLLLWTGHKFIWSSEEPVAPLVEALPEDDE